MPVLIWHKTVTFQDADKKNIKKYYNKYLKYSFEKHFFFKNYKLPLSQMKW